MVRFRLVWMMIVAGAAVGCAGGNSGIHPIPVAPQASTSPKMASGLFVVHIPASTKQSNHAKPAYVSPATQSVSFQVSSNPAQVVSLVPGGATCPLSGTYYTCTADFNAPIGNDTLIVKTFASANGTGAALSMNSIQVTIVAGQMNDVNVVLNGVVATLTLSLTPSSVVSGTASTVEATWGGVDATNNVIIGPGSLVDANGNAINPTLTSSSSNFVVPQATTSPQAWQIAYNGSPMTSSPTMTLGASGYSSVALTLSVQPASTPAPQTDWDSFGYDLARTGYNPKETTVGVSNVATLQKKWTFNVDSGPVWEPVLASGVTVNGTSTNVLYAGSSWGSTMYAINAETGALIWSKRVPFATYSCSTGVTSQFSIAGTPAIDRTKNLIYFADGYNQLHALDLSSGAEASGWPITIATYQPEHNFMHGGLTYNPANGILYAVTGSTCDISPWHGRIDAINTNTRTIIGTFEPAQGASGGGVWGAGGASIDPSTNVVYIATGNADETDPANNGLQNAAYSEQIVELSPDVGTIIVHNYPGNLPSVPTLDDLDFGTSPLLFQPPGCPPLLAALNKAGIFELYDRSTIANGPVEAIQMAVSSDQGIFIGAPAYDPVTNDVYVGLPSTYGVYQPGIAAFTVQSNCLLNATPAWVASFGPSSVSRSAITVANGVVYVSNAQGDAVFAFDAAMGSQLWTAGLTGFGTSGTIVANGYVYVTASDGTITAWSP
jgi:outer membrane protein assembly factor BamB